MIFNYLSSNPKLVIKKKFTPVVATTRKNEVEYFKMFLKKLWYFGIHFLKFSVATFEISLTGQGMIDIS